MTQTRISDAFSSGERFSNRQKHFTLDLGIIDKSLRRFNELKRYNCNTLKKYCHIDETTFSFLRPYLLYDLLNQTHKFLQGRSFESIRSDTR